MRHARRGALGGHRRHALPRHRRSAGVAGVLRELQPDRVPRGAAGRSLGGNQTFVLPSRCGPEVESRRRRGARRGYSVLPLQDARSSGRIAATPRRATWIFRGRPNARSGRSSTVERKSSLHGVAPRSSRAESQRRRGARRGYSEGSRTRRSGRRSMIEIRTDQSLPAQVAVLPVAAAPQEPRPLALGGRVVDVVSAAGDAFYRRLEESFAVREGSRDAFAWVADPASRWLADCRRPRGLSGGPRTGHGDAAGERDRPRGGSRRRRGCRVDRPRDADRVREGTPGADCADGGTPGGADGTLGGPRWDAGTRGRGAGAEVGTPRTPGSRDAGAADGTAGAAETPTTTQASTLARRSRRATASRARSRRATRRFEKRRSARRPREDASRPWT